MSFLTGTISINSGKFKKPFSKRTFVVLSIAEKLQRLKKATSDIQKQPLDIVRYWQGQLALKKRFLLPSFNFTISSFQKSGLSEKSVFSNLLPFSIF